MRNIYHSNKHNNHIPNYPFMSTTSFATNSNHAIEPIECHDDVEENLRYIVGRGGAVLGLEVMGG